MSTLITKLNTVFSDLKFDSQRHLYFVKGKNFPSVSRLVESHSPKYDAELWLPRSVDKYNRENPTTPKTIAQLRQEWKKINEDACDLGHETHDFMERFTGVQTPKTPQQKAGVKFFKDYIKDYDIVFRELRMRSLKYEYAGTEDLILQHKKTHDIITADYKTNKDLFKSFRGVFLHPPFDNMEMNPYNKIQIQLSYYQIMLEEIGLKVEDRWLVYLRADGEYRIFKLWNFTETLKQYMESKIAA